MGKMEDNLDCLNFEATEDSLKIFCNDMKSGFHSIKDSIVEGMPMDDRQRFLIIARMEMFGQLHRLSKLLIELMPKIMNY